jgi:hypothetical protein
VHPKLNLLSTGLPSYGIHVAKGIRERFIYISSDQGACPWLADVIRRHVVMSPTGSDIQREYKMSETADIDVKAKLHENKQNKQEE